MGAGQARGRHQHSLTGSVQTESMTRRGVSLPRRVFDYRRMFLFH